MTPLRLRITSDAAEVARVRRDIERFARGAGFDEATAGQIGLVVNEALANVIVHAYGGAIGRPVEVGAEMKGRTLSITIRDWGNGVDPSDLLRSKQPNPDEPGGLGLICLREMMDTVRFTPQPDGMLLVMTKAGASHG